MYHSFLFHLSADGHLGCFQRSLFKKSLQSPGINLLSLVSLLHLPQHPKDPLTPRLLQLSLLGYLELREENDDVCALQTDETNLPICLKDIHQVKVKYTPWTSETSTTSIGEDSRSHFMKLRMKYWLTTNWVGPPSFFSGGREKEVIQIFPKSGFL